jgi:hypothetical protein
MEPLAQRVRLGQRVQPHQRVDYFIYGVKETHHQQQATSLHLETVATVLQLELI